jgi:hypothetical protein
MGNAPDATLVLWLSLLEILPPHLRPLLFFLLLLPCRKLLKTCLLLVLLVVSPGTNCNRADTSTPGWKLPS